MASFVVKKSGGGSTVKGDDTIKAGAGGDQTVDFDDGSDRLLAGATFRTISVRNSQRLFRMRVLEAELLGPGVYILKCVEDNKRVFDTSLAGGSASGGVVGQAQIGNPVDTIPEIGITDIVLMDIPLFEDVDDDKPLGFYYVGFPANGKPADWAGARFFKSSDGGGSFIEHGDVIETAAVVGVATTALATVTRFGWDRTNTVTVRMLNGSLSNASIINTLNGSNLALLGTEVIGFTTVTDNGDNSFTLSGLIRGLKGTEQNTAGHAVGDCFVILSSTTARRTADGTSELNQARSYKALSIGGLLDEGITRSLTNTGIGSKPYAVAHLRATRDGSSNIDLTWVRRSRFRTGWNAANDSILSDSPESYEVDVYDENFTDLKRTLTSSTETVQYTIGQQTTDFGAAQNPVGFRVFQLNADFGRGYPRQAAL